jgi:urease accessory protein
MLVADTYLGSRTDDELSARIDREGALTVRLDGTERRRSRVRTTTAEGHDIGVVTARDLDAGDVLAADDDAAEADLAAGEAMVIDFAAADAPLTVGVALGHAVGNRHWNLAIRGETVAMPVTDRERMKREVRPLLPDGATLDYEQVPPSLFDGDDHEHGTGHGHEHGHDHEHGTGHDHPTERPTEPDR